ncbi:hypothetical protein Mapa_004726 [Marchantia paleacea]|nr:hypothetical protein Mapa_004726 [Marchantia paleacea]
MNPFTSLKVRLRRLTRGSAHVSTTTGQATRVHTTGHWRRHLNRAMCWRRPRRTRTTVTI